jgi:hypothetical protein
VYGKFRDYEHSEGGFDCISAGMRNLPLDLDTLHYTETIRDEDRLKKLIHYYYADSMDKMEINKKNWNDIAKTKLKLIDYLTRYIHKNE